MQNNIHLELICTDDDLHFASNKVLVELIYCGHHWAKKCVLIRELGVLISEARLICTP